MVLVKTQTGQEVLKDRRGSLSSRQRSAFILFDGKRSTAEILAATAPMGITQDDVQSMMDQGLLVPVAGHLAWQVATLDADDPENPLARFRSNRWAGALMAAACFVVGNAGA